VGAPEVPVETHERTPNAHRRLAYRSEASSAGLPADASQDARGDMGDRSRNESEDGDADAMNRPSAALREASQDALGNREQMAERLVKDGEADAINCNCGSAGRCAWSQDAAPQSGEQIAGTRSG
jgi:hypothetical protein